MGLEILFRDSAKSDRHRASHRFNLVSKVCGLYAFSLMPDLGVVLTVEEAKMNPDEENPDSDTNSEQSYDSDRGSRLHFDRPGDFVYDYEAYIKSSSLKFN